MELKFLGRGSAFNYKEGNTAAYFIEEKQLFLIDCGESIFTRIISNELLESIKEINIMITHTHSDHIGSLGSLVTYCFYNLKIPVKIIVSKEAKHLPNILKILECFGCTSDMYSIVDDESYDNKYDSFYSLRYIETKHCKPLDCYSLLFKTKNGLVYYSGDTCEINTIKGLIASGEVIDKIYVDTTTADFLGNVHLNIEILKREIPPLFIRNIYCMHFNDDEGIEQAKNWGFNVAEVENSKKLVLEKK